MIRRRAGWRSASSSRIARDLRGVGRDAADAPPLVLDHLTTEDGLPQAHRHDDPAGLAGLRLARHRGRARALRRPRALPLRALAHRAAARCPATSSGKSSRTRDTTSGSRSRTPVSRAGIAAPTRSRSTGTTRATQARSRATASAPCSSMGADGVDRARSDAGVDILDPVLRGIEHLRHDPNSAGSLASDRVDLPAGAGPRRRRVDRHRRRPRSLAAQRRRTIRHASRRCKASRSREILEDQSGTLWVGTFDAGLMRLDRDGRVLRDVPPRRSATPTSLGSDDVRALLEDRSGRLVGRHSRRPRLLDRSTGRVHVTIDTTRTTARRCATRSSCRCTRTTRASSGSARARAASAAGIRAAGSSAGIARRGSESAGHRVR